MRSEDIVLESLKDRKETEHAALVEAARTLDFETLKKQMKMIEYVDRVISLIDQEC